MCIKPLTIAGRQIGQGHPVFIIAEMSANHNQRIEEAINLIKAAKDCGADAIKIQTYTADTMTIDCDNDYFKIKGTIWEGQNLYKLYQKAYTPWEWQGKLKKLAEDLGLIFFSTPFDRSSVDFLEKIDVPAYKIASFELIDIPLIEYVASKNKPIIMSRGMGTLSEITEAVEAVAKYNLKDQLALLHCTSAYPAPPEEMNLKTIQHLADTFQVVSGLSDHTLGISIPVAGVALGACILEKHFTISRNANGLDSTFSLEPAEFKELVTSVRAVEKAIGKPSYTVGAKEAESRKYRRSLFVVKDIAEGETLTEDNVRSIRPGNGLPPKYLNKILGKKAKTALKKGTPLCWEDF